MSSKGNSQDILFSNRRVYSNINITSLRKKILCKTTTINHKVKWIKEILQKFPLFIIKNDFYFAILFFCFQSRSVSLQSVFIRLKMVSFELRHDCILPPSFLECEKNSLESYVFQNEKCLKCSSSALFSFLGKIIYICTV